MSNNSHCAICSKVTYVADIPSPVIFDKHLFHHSCAKCYECGTQLTAATARKPRTLNSMNDSKYFLLCSVHYNSYTIRDDKKTEGEDESHLIPVIESTLPTTSKQDYLVERIICNGELLERTQFTAATCTYSISIENSTPFDSTLKYVLDGAENILLIQGDTSTEKSIFIPKLTTSETVEFQVEDASKAFYFHYVLHWTKHQVAYGQARVEPEVNEVENSYLDQLVKEADEIDVQYIGGYRVVRRKNK